MGFRVRNDAKKWFKKIRDQKDNNFNMDFDSYYYCLITGLLAEDQTDIHPNDTSELLDYFPGIYKTKGKILIGLFLSKELKKNAVSFEERTHVHSIISKLIQPETLANLSDEGMKQFNRYANAGFEVLVNNIDKPESIVDFLISFDKYVKNNNY